MNDEERRSRVRESLDNALDNDYTNTLTLPPEVVADDLCDYDADLQDEDPALLMPHVEEWQNDHYL